MSSDADLDRAALRESFLLTDKPFIYVFNLDDTGARRRGPAREARRAGAPAPAVFVSAKLESELIGLDEAEPRSCCASTARSESGLAILARVGFETLGLQTYLTAGTEGVARLDDPQGLAPRRRPPASSTPTSSAGSSRPRSSRTTTSSPPARWPLPRRRQGADRRQGLRHAGRRRRRVPLQRAKSDVWPGVAGMAEAANHSDRPAASPIG